MHKSIVNVCAECYSEFEVIYEVVKRNRSCNSNHGNGLPSSYWLESVKLSEADMKILHVIVLCLFFAGCGQTTPTSAAAQLKKACNMACYGGQVAGLNQCYCVYPQN